MASKVRIRGTKPRTRKKKNVRARRVAKAPAKPTPVDHVMDEKRTAPTGSIVSPEFRFATNIDHREYGQSEMPPEPEPEPDLEAPPEPERIDGVEVVRDSELEPVHDAGFVERVETVRYVFAECYRVELADGEIIVGDYKGNRRVAPADYDPETWPEGSTWQIFLREYDDDEEGDDRMFTLDQCEPLWDIGDARLDKMNSRRERFKQPRTKNEWEELVPHRPDIGMIVFHSELQMGTVVEVTGGTDHWYATVEYEYHGDPVVGQDVRCSTIRKNAKRGERRAWRSATIVDIAKRRVTVEYADETEESFPLSRFRKKFRPTVTYTHETFHETFGLAPTGWHRVTVTRTYRFGRYDARTTYERMAYDSGATATAMSESITRNSGSVTEFKPDRSRRRIKNGNAVRERKMRNGEIVASEVTARMEQATRILRERKMLEHLMRVCDGQTERPWFSWRDVGIDGVIDCVDFPEPEPEPFTTLYQYDYPIGPKPLANGDDGVVVGSVADANGGTVMF